MPKKDLNHGPAVADEDPDHSPMDQKKTPDDDGKVSADDQPGAAGERGAGAEEDTYD